MVDVLQMSLPARLRAQAFRLRTHHHSTAGRIRLVYFLVWAVSGTSLPYLAEYLRGRGFTGGEIGTIQMIPSLVAPVVALSWARVAERLGDPVRVLGWISAWAALAAVFLPFAATPLAVGAVIFAMTLGDRAVVPLLDATSLEYCRTHPGVAYSRFRMFGSVGFAALSLVLGYVLSLRGNLPGDVVVPATMAVFAACYALAIRRLEPAPSVLSEQPSWRDLITILSSRRLLLILLAGAVHWAACVVYSTFFNVFVRDLGLPASVSGWSFTAGVVAEISVMMAFPWIHRRLSPRVLLVIAFLGSAVRWALLARATGPAAIISLQLFHGLTYGLFWSTLIQVVSEMVPPGKRATGLALSSAIVGGIGAGLGAKLMGRAYDQTHSFSPLLRWSAAADLALALGVMALLARRFTRSLPARR
jgi:PPP family 3-phenylpropionic acid transporter